MSQPYQDLDAAIEERRRMRARRRRLLHLRRALIVCVALILLALMIATPIWIINGVRNRADQSEGAAEPTTTTTPAPTSAPTKPLAAVTDEQTVQLTDQVDAEYVVLLDMTDGRVVAAKNPDQTHAPASITKVLTLLTAVENIDDLNTPYTMSWKVIDPAYKVGANTTGLESGETVRLEDLLYGCGLRSGADATAALADYAADGEADYGAEDEETFADMMNRRAQEMGATNTHFTNASGLDHRNHVTTARDMALIMATAMRNPICRQVLMTEKYLLPSTEQHPEGIQLYSNLFNTVDNSVIKAGKTGWTPMAGNTLVTYTVGADGHEYVCVTMQNAGHRKALADTLALYKEYCGLE